MSKAEKIHQGHDDIRQQAERLGVDWDNLPDREPVEGFVSVGDAAASVVKKLLDERKGDDERAI